MRFTSPLYWTLCEGALCHLPSRRPAGGCESLCGDGGLHIRLVGERDRVAKLLCRVRLRKDGRRQGGHRLLVRLQPQAVRAADVLAEVRPRGGQEDPGPVLRRRDGRRDGAGTAPDDDDVHVVEERESAWRTPRRRRRGRAACEDAASILALRGAAKHPASVPRRQTSSSDNVRRHPRMIASFPNPGPAGSRMSPRANPALPGRFDDPKLIPWRQLSSLWPVFQREPVTKRPVLRRIIGRMVLQKRSGSGIKRGLKGVGRSVIGVRCRRGERLRK